MKRLFFFLLVLFLSRGTNIAFAKDDICKAQVKGNTEYAQWGLQLRAEMLNKCGRQPSKRCQSAYEQKIDEIDEKNREAVKKAFPNPSEKDPAFVEVVGRNLDLKMSAIYGLAGLHGGSAARIADIQYRLCKGLPLEDPKPTARGGRGMPPMPPPMMPMEPSISSRLSPMQPDMGGGAAFGGCTNYNYIGPNGQAVFCQKCCGPDGNCQVICN